MGGGVNGVLKSQGCASEAVITKNIVVAVLDRDGGRRRRMTVVASMVALPQAQIVGWPPIRSFRKSITASALAKSNEDVEGKSAVAGCLYMKVGRRRTYAELLTALEQMFSCFTIASGSRASKELSGGEISSQKQLSVPVSSSEYALTYKDKDGDWILVGDVPWRCVKHYNLEECAILNGGV